MSIIEVHQDDRDYENKTRMCLVCHSFENKNCVHADVLYPYLCDRCRAALLKIVESEEAPDGKRTDR